MDNFALFLSIGLIAIALIVSRQGRLGLEKDLMIGTIRTFVQLIAVGFILQFIFDLNSPFFVLLMLAVMVAVAAANASKRGRQIPHLFLLTFCAIGLGSLFTLGSLIALGLVEPIPRFVIPIAGMLIGNSMKVCSLSVDRLHSELCHRRWEVEAALALGATPRQAGNLSIRETVRTALIPTIDSMKTVGIVSLPGMMTGQIIAGASPLLAIRYQIMVMYMITAADSIAALTINFLVFRAYFTPAAQLKGKLLR